MPQTDSAKKALRVSARRRNLNEQWRRKVHAAVRAVREAITAKDQSAAEKAFQAAQAMLDRAARRNVIHPNKAARKKSRLRHHIASLSKAAS